MISKELLSEVLEAVKTHLVPLGNDFKRALQVSVHKE
jgi:hypothetical protein